MNKAKFDKKILIIGGMVIGAIVIASVVAGLLSANWGSNKVTVCTEMDYQGDIGPCTKTKTVEIVADPDAHGGCPADTEPVYDVVGGFVGVKLVGCTRK